MNTFSFKRVLTLALALLTLCGVVLGTVACADTNEGPGANTNPSESAGESGSGESETVAAYSTVEKQNFNKEFVILTREDLVEDMYIEDLKDSDLLDASIYERNVAISEDFGITFEVITKDGYEKIDDEIKLQSTGGLDEFDMYIGHKFSFANCAQQNYCLNLNDIEPLQLDQPWWDQNCYDNLTIDGKTYLMTGDINPSSMRISACMIYNKNLMKNLQKSSDELNTLTQNGQWTLDVLYEYTQEVSQDISGDGVMDYNDDQYGLVSWMMDIPYSMYYGSGKKFISIVDGAPELAYSQEDVLGVYSKLYKIIVENESYFVTDADIWNSCYDVFRDGRALFCDITLGKITTYIVNEGMNDAYGILPIPKYSTAQEEYLSFVNGASALVMVANTKADTEYVGTIMEAMATYNYDKVTPNMFEVVTKLQAAQDPVSSRMVDYIIRNRIYDLGYWYDFSIANVVNEGLKGKKDTIATDLKKADKAAKSSLKNLIAAYDKCD